MQKNNSLKSNIYFLASIFFHLLLLLIIVFHPIFKAKIDNHKISYLPIHIYQSSLQPYFKQENKRKIIKTNKSLIIKKVHDENKSFEEKNSKLTIQNQQNQNNPDVKMSHQTLLNILHSKIAAKQIYPESAILLNQTGTVHISFILNPDGSLINIYLQKSSGVESIDLAALNAVKMVGLITEAASFLHQPESFSIEILFQ